MPFGSWPSWPNLADGTDDKVADAVPNLVEFALGMNPQILDLHFLPKLTIEGGYAILTLTDHDAFRRAWVSWCRP
jgi:hypothetical protein